MLGFEFLRRNASSPCSVFQHTNMHTNAHVHTPRVKGRIPCHQFYRGCREVSGNRRKVPNARTKHVLQVQKSRAITSKVQRQLCDSTHQTNFNLRICVSVKNKTLVVEGMIATLNYRAFWGVFWELSKQSVNTVLLCVVPLTIFENAGGRTN